MTLKIGVYLTDDVARRFRTALRRTRTTKSALVNEALARFLSPPPAKEPGEEVLQAVRAVMKRVRWLQRETLVLSETLAVFVRWHLMVAVPVPVPEDERPALERLGRQRYEVFVREVGKRVASDTGLIADVMRSIMATRPDLAAQVMAEAEAQNASGTLPFGDACSAQACKPGKAGSHA